MFLKNLFVKLLRLVFYGAWVCVVRIQKYKEIFLNMVLGILCLLTGLGAAFFLARLPKI